ncbi:hypothetical protein ACHAW5_005491 [Stephanodiscus triporus]|uniref:Uncharacterized protein n=1 Tax=Stephanodiscus triporus TaxID=2934178 RepID=A0ABD3MGZ5_9STRA
MGRKKSQKQRRAGEKKDASPTLDESRQATEKTIVERLEDDADAAGSGGAIAATENVGGGDENTAADAGIDDDRMDSFVEWMNGDAAGSGGAIAATDDVGEDGEKTAADDDGHDAFSPTDVIAAAAASSNDDSAAADEVGEDMFSFIGDLRMLGMVDQPDRNDCGEEERESSPLMPVEDESCDAHPIELALPRDVDVNSEPAIGELASRGHDPVDESTKTDKVVGGKRKERKSNDRSPKAAGGMEVLIDGSWILVNDNNIEEESVVDDGEVGLSLIRKLARKIAARSCCCSKELR